jgi:hypothetical protein
MPTNPQLVDVDLDALAPAAKRVKLDGKVWKLPGDMPLSLFLHLQAYEQRIEAGVDETVLLEEMAGNLLELLQVHQPQLKALPKIGLQTLVKALPAVYSGAAVGEQKPNRAARRTTTKTRSGSQKTTRARATSR